MKACVVVFPGSNCDYDVFYVLKEVVDIDTYFVWHEEEDVSMYSLVVLPGGFSYGDYVRPGVLASFSPVVRSLYDYVEKEKGLVLGICNGFQILTEAGFLPGALTRNVHGKFVCKTVDLEVINTDTPFTSAFGKRRIVKIPIAHSDGRYVADENTLHELEASGRIAFKYMDNPNGSMRSIAGVFNDRFNVLGMMPHPERRSEGILGEGSKDGLLLFESIRDFIRKF